MSRFGRVLSNLLKDIATLKKPTTAAALVATILAITGPLGITVGITAKVMISIVAAIGLVASAIEELIADINASKAPQINSVPADPVAAVATHGYDVHLITKIGDRVVDEQKVSP